MIDAPYKAVDFIIKNANEILDITINHPDRGNGMSDPMINELGDLVDRPRDARAALRLQPGQRGEDRHQVAPAAPGRHEGPHLLVERHQPDRGAGAGQEIRHRHRRPADRRHHAPPGGAALTARSAA